MFTKIIVSWNSRALAKVKHDTSCRTGGGQIATKGPIANIRTDASHSTMNDDVSSFLCNI
ncbi:hypothetical protein ACHAQH_004957 [Verticillium albo-atrum]